MLHRFTNIDNSNKQIIAYLKKKWTLGRVFRWLKGLYPDYGESIVLAHILNVAKENKHTFSRSKISYAISKNVDEQLDSRTKNWLRGIGTD